MPVELIEANPAVREDIGKLAVMRGPLVYCLEQTDNGENLHLVRLCAGASFEVREESELLDGIVTVSCEGKKVCSSNWEDTLYRFAKEETLEDIKLRFIPYYTWANRGQGEMCVWVRRK